MKRRRTLITSPLKWQLTAEPVLPPMVPVLSERGGTQLKTPQPVVLVDTREQTPFDFRRFEGWFAGIEKKGAPARRLFDSWYGRAVCGGAQGPFGSGSLLHHGPDYVYQPYAADGILSPF
jgi:hypothetical protein